MHSSGWSEIHERARTPAPAPATGTSRSTRRSPRMPANAAARRRCASTAGRRRRCRSATPRTPRAIWTSRPARRPASPCRPPRHGSHAVLHDREVTYSVAVPAATPPSAPGSTQPIAPSPPGSSPGWGCLASTPRLRRRGGAGRTTPPPRVLRVRVAPRDTCRRPRARRQRAAAQRRRVPPARFDPRRGPRGEAGGTFSVRAPRSATRRAASGTAIATATMRRWRGWPGCSGPARHTAGSPPPWPRVAPPPGACGWSPGNRLRPRSPPPAR